MCIRDRNRTHVQLAVGLTADIKVGSKLSYEVIKIDGEERFCEWDIEEGGDVYKRQGSHWITKRILMNLSVIHSLACVGRIKQQYIQYLLVSSTQMTHTQMIGIILLVHFMVLTVVHVRKKVVM